MTKLVMLLFAALTIGAGYMTWYGIGAESSGVVRSVRAGSLGNGAAYGVK